MTETTTSDRPTPITGRFAHFRIKSRIGRHPVLGAALILALAIACYTLGRHSAGHEVDEYKTRNAQLESEIGQLRGANTKKETQIADLRAQVDAAQKKVAALAPPLENTFNINSNTSLILADGRLTVGLVGTPRNDGVSLNINNNQHVAAAGDVIDVSPDSSTNCRIEVVSFDILESLATVSATCVAAKH